MIDLRLISVATLLLFGPAPAAASEEAAAVQRPLRLAVASNFRQTAEALIEKFRAARPGDATLSSGSTGKLYAQIVNGAPFDVLLAADADRPALLEQSGLAVPDSRFTYALGTLVLWSRDPSLAGGGCENALAQADGGRIAMANPLTAPYGIAARQTLAELGVLESVEPRLVFGENVGQAMQFAASGNAALGFVANAQLRIAALPATSCRWTVPARYHEPIRQQAVLLRRGEDHPLARAFLAYLRSGEAQVVIERDGYRIEAAD